MSTVTTTTYDERLDVVTNDLLESVRAVLIKHRVNHGEYAQAILWIRDLVKAGEVPMFIDCFFERTVEQVTYAGMPGSAGTVQGPYYLPGAKLLSEKPYVMPMRDDEPGEPMVLKGLVVDLDHRPIDGALIDIWHAGNDGTYSGFVGDAPQGNLRAKLHTDEDGSFRIRTIRPAPYQIPMRGPTGRYLERIDRHAWRPAHFHLRVSAPSYDLLTTQLYFRGGEWLEGEGDVSGAVKEALKVDVVQDHDAQIASDFGLATPFHSTEYTFVLRPEGTDVP